MSRRVFRLPKNRRLLAKTSIVLLLAAFPGFLELPALAEARQTRPQALGLPPQAVSGELPDDPIPVQLPGDANGRPHLVDVSDTTSNLPTVPSKQDVTLPRGAVPAEVRHRTSDIPATGGLKKPPPLPSAKTAAEPTLATALAKARQSGKRTPVETATTETSITYANPDGTLTTEVSAEVARVRRGPAWVPIDLTLVESGGVLRPKAGKTDVSFSAGGSGPLVSLVKSPTETLALTWPETLPEPVLKGNTATYRGAAGENADLVVTMLPTGFTQDVILRKRPDDPVKITMGVEGEGLSLAETSSGGLKLTTDTGRTIASAPVPVMYDTSAQDPATIDTKVVTKGGEQSLVLTPDAEFLADPDTVYPVTVDPTITLTPTTDLYVSSASPTSSYGSLQYLSVGGGDQAFADFTVPSLAGSTVSAASLLVAGTFNASGCTSVRINRVTSSWAAGTTWNTRPSVTTTGQATGTGTTSGITTNITAIVQAWAAGEPEYGLRLDNTTTQCRIQSSETSYYPILSITHSAASLGVSNPGIQPAVTGEDGVKISSLTPQLTAMVTGSGSGLKGEFQVQAGGSQVWSGQSGTVSSGATATATVPSGILSDGQAIQYRARAIINGGSSSSWTAWQDARVTSTAIDSLTFKMFSPVDNTQVGTLTPALSAHAEGPGEAATTYWYQVCSGTQGNWSWCESSPWVKGAWTVPANKLDYGKTYWWYAQAATGATTITSPWRTFIPTPEQASINSLLASGAEGREFDHVTGNYTTSSTDLVVASAGPPLSVVRTYNSLDPRTDGAFGAGWTSRWDTRLVNEPKTKTVLITYPDGKQWRFAKRSDGGFAAPEGMYATLATQPGGGWRLMDKESTSYWFDSGGRLTQVTDHRGRTQTLTYNGAGKLATATGTGGRTLTFTWTGPHVTSVSTASVGGSPLTYTYQYTGDLLTKACGPAAGGACTDYEYGNDSRYHSSVWDANPFGYWRLNENSAALGTVVANQTDAITRVDGGRIRGGTADATAGVTAPLEESSDPAMRFGGTNNSAYVSLPPGMINAQGGEISVEAWFKTTTKGTILGYQNSATSNPTAYTPALYVGADGKLRGQFWNGTAAPITSTGTVNDGDWHHAILTGAGDSQTLYLDGQPVGTLSGLIAHLGQWDTRIGYGFGSASWPSTVGSAGPFAFGGDIDEVAVYNKPLSAEQVATHHGTRSKRRQITKITDSTGRIRATNTYKADGGRLLTHTDRNGGLWQLSAPVHTKVSSTETTATITVTDPANETLVYKTDAWRGNRLISKTDQLNKVTSFEYDAAGFPSKMTDPNGNITRYAHDARGNMVGRNSCRTSTVCFWEWFSYEWYADPFDPRNDRMNAHRDARSASSVDNTYLRRWTYNTFGEVTSDKRPVPGSPIPPPPTPSPSPSPSASPSPAPGLVAAYGMDAGTGATVTDASGLGNHGTGNAATWQAGKYGQALDFNTSTSTVYVPDHSSLDLSNGLTVEAWVKPETNPVESTLLVKHHGSDLAYHLETRYGSDPPNFTVRMSGELAYRKAEHSSMLPIGEWTHLAATFNGTTISMYVNGTLVDTNTSGSAYTIQNGSGGLYIGGTPHWGAYFDGLVDEVRIYNRALTQPQIAADMTTPISGGGPAPGPSPSPSPSPQPEPEMAGTTWTYTDGSGGVPAGLVAGMSDALGNETTYEYNAAGDLIEQTSPTGLVTAFGRDAIGRQTTKTDVTPAYPGGITTTYAYDTRGRLETVTEPAVENEVTDVVHTKRTTYTYDTAGRPLTETVSDLTGGDPPRQTSYAYDTRGRVVSVTDPEGGVRQQTWNTRGLQTSVTNEVGTRVDYGYNDRGERTTETLQDWTGNPNNPQSAADVVMASYAYDPGGRLASTTDAMGRTTRFTYGNDDTVTQKIADDARLNGSTTPRDVVLEASTYDPAGNLTRVVAGGGKTTTDYVYDAATRLISTTADPAGAARKTVYAYDNAGRVTSTTATAAGGPRAEVVGFTYDDEGRVTHKTVENGATDLVSTMVYGDRGDPTQVTSPGGNTTQFRYDPAGRLAERKQPSVNVERDGAAAVAQQPITRFGFNTSGDPTHVTDPEGRTKVTAYDKAGRATGSTSPSYTRPGGSPVTPATAIAYDDAGRATNATDALGQTRSTLYDALGRVVRVTDPPATTGATPGRTDYTYTLNGELLSQVDPTGARQEATYDDLGRQITTTAIERKPSTVTLTGHAEYDDAGNLLSEQRPAGDSADAVVNAFGEITSLTDALGKTTTFGYDLAGRQTSVTDPLGNKSVTTYDLAGRPTAVADLDDAGATLRTRTTGFSSDGHPTTMVDAEGRTRTAAFDAIGRMTQLVEPVSAGVSITTSFGYDAAGARTRYTDGRGNATITTYNTLGLTESLIEPSTTAHPNAADRTWTTGYDAKGNPITEVQPGGVTITRTFDNLGRLTGQTGSGGGAATTAAKTFGYDLAGRMTSAGDLTFSLNDRGALLKTTKSGVDQATFAYDANGRLTQRGDAAGATSFTWNGGDRLTTMTDPLTGVTVSYGYDDAGRRTSATHGSGGPARTYAYDDLDRLTSDVLKTGGGANLASITYGYDLENRLTAKTTTGTAGAGANTYAYDHSGRLTSWTSPTATTAYAWDASGNRTQAGSDTFTYDQRNRLTTGAGTDYTYTPRGTQATATKAGVTVNSTFDAFNRMITDGSVTYAYDTLDRMSTRTQSGVTSKYVYASLSNDLAAVTDAAGVAQEIYNRDATGAVVSSRTGSATAQFQLTDRHRDAVASFTAGATSLSGSTAYDPFGTVITTGGTRPQLGYQSSWTDPDTTKANMAARWYQPGTGTFNSRDTMTLPAAPSGQANRYAYALGSPLSRIDPSGHASLELDLDVSFENDGGIEVCRGTDCGAYYHKVWETTYVPLPPDPRFKDDIAKELGVMNNGRKPEKDIDYWGMTEATQIEYLKDYNPLLSYEEQIGAAMDAAIATGDLKSLEKLMAVTRDKLGAPKGASAKEYYGLMKQQQKARETMASCQAKIEKGIDASACKRLIRGEWNKWRGIFCKDGFFAPEGDWECNLRDVAVYGSWTAAVLKGEFLPLKLVKFLASQDPTLPDSVFTRRLIAWAEKEGGKGMNCRFHDEYHMTVCSGLKSGVHFGRGATTLGSVMLTSKPLHVWNLTTSRDYIVTYMAHEARHTRQWQDYYVAGGNFWPTYLVFYLWEGPNECTNLYERQAEDAGNVYTC
ncbi:hypothetical protein Aph01nite_78680 [Acrocarpospora phusangensis]|uniref:LamG-like jellyroll fold domain-containing protein n=1 Tax=Acrocarpospora phusangensis TaxID=1070424 RepID=A0A919QIS3_9ACTN|nr:LamG-like jellyroll fold domain-containing protein [Acrocarpospora phusangensis]GIH29558.1 hypothetical protein Aph01nite_78680 [Acrocarpospora phusangensis]